VAADQDLSLLTDLLILDPSLPGMTGAELAREVRRRRLQLPILLAAGFAEFEGTKVTDVLRLVKAYTQAQLANEIARLLPFVESGERHGSLAASNGRILGPQHGSPKDGHPCAKRTCRRG
jgi:two-component SAPR family response regulator